MKIGIIVHSKTGNTYSVAQALKEKLSAAGHSVNLESVTAVNEDQGGAADIQLLSRPDIDAYDVLIFGAPVRGYALSPVMAAYLERLKSNQGKTAACFITQFFPSPTMGGNRSMDQMKALCSAKGIEVCAAGIVNWSSIYRKRKIADIVEGFSKMFC